MKYSNNFGLLASFMVTLFASLSSASTITALPAAIPSSSWTAAYALAACPQPATEIAQIVNALALYPLAVDGGNFSALSLVFIEDVVAYYPAGGLGLLTSLSALEKGIAAASANTNSQHLYGTQTVVITGEGQAKSLTYFTATLFGKGVYYGEVCHFYGIPRKLGFSGCVIRGVLRYSIAFKLLACIITSVEAAS